MERDTNSGRDMAKELRIRRAEDLDLALWPVAVEAGIPVKRAASWADMIVRFSDGIPNIFPSRDKGAEVEMMVGGQGIRLKLFTDFFSVEIPEGETNGRFYVACKQPVLEVIHSSGRRENPDEESLWLQTGPEGSDFGVVIVKREEGGVNIAAGSMQGLFE